MFKSLLLALIVPGVEIDGKWLDVASASEQGLVIAEIADKDGKRVMLENKSDKPIYPEELGWAQFGVDPSFHPMKVYLESWQMASPCGVRNWDDEPFDYSPGYLHNCVSTPKDFQPGEKGAFSPITNVASVMRKARCASTALRRARIASGTSG